MAPHHWIDGTADGDFETPGNWSATKGGSSNGTTPGSSDAVFLSDDTVGNCTLSANISIASIIFTSSGAYTGTFDAATFNIACSGNFGSRISGPTIDFGSGTHTISGNFSLRDSTTVHGTATIILDGTTKTLEGILNVYNLQIDGTITHTENSIVPKNLLTINGTLNLSTIASHFYMASGVNLVIGTNGILGNSSSAGSIIFQSGSGHLTSFGASAAITSTGTLNWQRKPAATYTFPATDYACKIKFETDGGATGCDLVFADATTFSNEVKFLGRDASDKLTILQTTNNPSLTFKDDIIVDNTNLTSANFIWTKGTGSITFSGTANQSIDFDGEAVEDITIDKTAGKVTLTGEGSTDSVTCTDGELDIDANNLTTVSSGNFTVAANFTLSDTTGGGLITVAGNLDINGTSGNTVTWNGPDLDVAGTADADFTVVTNSDASAGTEVDATDNCTDSGGNTNWNFAAAGPPVGTLALLGVGA